ncbi:hypothetical protein C8F04DRAFT_1173402 [Mycena alexandri]|uniref:Uncharacterized protein n=1 Tax=Mycena alexandri TaxID=1745969 RepID=A0AAD6TMC8_9AGAR|nr:hypothetical protein C8F04DRAFT_1173402 [Mycena alexandri]
MDADRKSTVSSFYGGRKGSMDALNQDFPSPTAEYGPQTGRTRDDASSFFNPERNSRGSVDLLAGRAGYNRGSFFRAGREEPLKGGRDEEELVPEPGDSGWDVYADFNNAGPRYSSAFGQQDTGYQSLGNGTPKVEETSAGPVEMVTVPALGPEWKKSEMRDMTKAGKREKKAESRRQLWQDWTRGNRGGKWLTKRVIVFFCFGLVAIIVVVIAFCIPRVPSFSLSNNTPLANATGSWASAVPTEFSRVPANFSFPAFIDLQADTTGNYIPLKFQHLRAQVYDLDSDFLIGTGDLGHKTLPAKAFPDVQIPINFTYSATNDSDTTWNNWYDACKNKDRFASGDRPGVRFRLILQMVITGLPGTHTTSTQVSNANCPIELPSNSV